MRPGAASKRSSEAREGFVPHNDEALVASDRPECAEHRARVEFCVVPCGPGPGGRSGQPVAATGPTSTVPRRMRSTGARRRRSSRSRALLLGKTRTADVLDAVVVTTALRRDASILTSDPEDIESLVRASGGGAVVIAV